MVSNSLLAVHDALSTSLNTCDGWQVLRSLAEGCGLDEGAQGLSLGLQQHSSSTQNGALEPRPSMDGATPQYEHLQVQLTESLLWCS